MKIGITERGDAGLDLSWIKKINDVDGIILITKHANLIPKEYIEGPAIVHSTITGLGRTPIEPNVPSPEESIKYYKKLIEEFGPEKIVLRVDPIFVSFNDDIWKNIAKECLGRIRISFYDNYKHSKDRLLKRGYAINQSFHAPLNIRNRIFQEITDITRKEVEICGEPGMRCSGCVSKRDVLGMGLDVSKLSKNKGGFQREFCLCLAEKTELLSERKPCLSGCAYCYWKNN